MLQFLFIAFLLILVISRFGFDGRIWVLIASIPDLCILFTFFSKVFDKVNHSNLLSKLHQYGVRGTALAWIRAFLVNPSQTVVFDDDESGSVSLSSRVPQGSNSLLVRASASGAVGRGFAPRSRHTKGAKNGTNSYLADAHIKKGERFRAVNTSNSSYSSNKSNSKSCLSTHAQTLGSTRLQ